MSRRRPAFQRQPAAFATNGDLVAIVEQNVRLSPAGLADHTTALGHEGFQSPAARDVISVHMGVDYNGNRMPSSRGKPWPYLHIGDVSRVAG